MGGGPRGFSGKYNEKFYRTFFMIVFRFGFLKFTKPIILNRELDVEAVDVIN